MKYKRGRTRFSEYRGYEVVDILRQKKLFGLIPVWVISDSIRNLGQVDEVVMLLNNPDELKRRLNESFAELNKAGLL